MLPNLIPALLLIPLLNWFVPWFIARFEQWRAGIRFLSLVLMTLFFFVLFVLDYPVTLFRDHGFFKQWAGKEIYIFDSAEFFFLLTVGINLFIVFLMLLKARKLKWFANLIGIILFAFCLNIIAVYLSAQFSLLSYSSSSVEYSMASLHKKPKVSLPFVAQYLVKRLVGKTDEIGQRALANKDVFLWQRYQYLENLLYSDNTVSDEIVSALKMQSPDFISVLKYERGFDSETIEALRRYNDKK